MSWFKKKDANAIPPVSQPTPPPPSSSTRASARTYTPNAEVGRYDSVAYVASKGPVNNSSEPGLEGNYGRYRGTNDLYKSQDVDRNRNELFSGYNAEKSGGSGRFFDGPDYKSSAAPGEEEEEDVEAIKKQTRWVKQESANSTRNALRLAREAEETARNTLQRLGDQSEMLANTERHLDVAKGHSLRAEDRTDELKQLNRSIFRPVITFNKDKKRAAQEAKVQARYEDERMNREEAMKDVRQTQNRLAAVNNHEGFKSSRLQNALRNEDRKRYQFEATASDDELEDEIDGNLDEIGEAAARLKALGMAMGQELDQQNTRIERIDGKTVGLDNRLIRNTDRLKRIS